MSEEQLRPLETMLAKPTGLMLVTGPTGSGKSTSLYAFLSMLNTGKVNIVTIEDPIEHELPGITQIQVQPKIGLSFSTGLRSMLRHDPDIIMVGEIRDQETAQLAVRAALTGHLVLSTLHTNDAASGITRLLDLDIEPFLLCSTLTGVLSQRLLRQLCVECRYATEVDIATLSSLSLPMPSQAGRLHPVPREAPPVKPWYGVHLNHAKGCQQCRNTGYRGRTGVFELLAIDHHIRSLILKRTSSAQIRQSAIAKGMQTSWQSGWQKVQAGTASLDELIRVLPQEAR
jgi:general secretion pathway protein E